MLWMGLILDFLFHLLPAYTWLSNCCFHFYLLVSIMAEAGKHRDQVLRLDCVFANCSALGALWIFYRHLLVTVLVFILVLYFFLDGPPENDCCYN